MHGFFKHQPAELTLLLFVPIKKDLTSSIKNAETFAWVIIKTYICGTSKRINATSDKS